MTQLGTAENPFKVAIVGSGPAGFYAAGPLIQNKEIVFHVDMFERLPTPFGLVRTGVAPDHQKIKNVTRSFEKLMESERFRFFGNVMLSRDIKISELRDYYDVIILAVGAQTDRKLNIPGIDLPGSHTATEFVWWYNGHPDYTALKFDLSGEVAYVIGQGNVAVDVVRILAKTVDELKVTDIADYALEALSQSRIREIHMVGRRGPVQAAFTRAEIKELGELEDCDIVFNDLQDLNLNPASQKELEDPKNAHARGNWEILQEYAKRKPAGKKKKIVLHFYQSPVELKGERKVERLVLGKNRLEGEPFQQKAVPRGDSEEVPCDIFFRSIGYRGVPIEGVPFDDSKGVIPNERGRVVDESGNMVKGLYCVGWIKRGPSGVIGTNKPDSLETVQMMLEDLNSLDPAPKRDDFVQVLEEKGVVYLTYEDWRKIDEEEIRRGQKVGRPRVKFTNLEEILKFLGKK